MMPLITSEIFAIPNTVLRDHFIPMNSSQYPSGNNFKISSSEIFKFSLQMFSFLSHLNPKLWNLKIWKVDYGHFMTI